MSNQTLESERVCQGDIFRDIEYIEYVQEVKGTVEISRIVFPLVIVLTQDCDLELDFCFRSADSSKSTQDKYLLSVLVAPLYNLEHVRKGEHLTEIGMHMATIPGKTERQYLETNQRPRYHYLNFSPDIPIAPSVIDFKHYFSVNIIYLSKIKKDKFVCSVSLLYREDISQRFASFLARIGLPDPSLTKVSYDVHDLG